MEKDKEERKKSKDKDKEKDKEKHAKRRKNILASIASLALSEGDPDDDPKSSKSSKSSRSGASAVHRHSLRISNTSTVAAALRAGAPGGAQGDRAAAVASPRAGSRMPHASSRLVRQRTLGEVAVEDVKALIAEQYGQRKGGVGTLQAVGGLERDDQVQQRAQQAEAAEWRGFVARWGSDVGNIRARLRLVDDHSRQMVDILSTFSSRLTELEASTRSINADTQRLKLIHSNVDATLEYVAKTLEIYGLATKLEPRVREGPSEDRAGYFVLLEKLTEAEKFLTENRTFRGSQEALSQLKPVKQIAVDECEKLFSSLVRRQSAPVDPAKTNFEEGLVEPKALEELKTVVDYLSKAGSTSYPSSYTEHRMHFVTGSLQKMLPDKIACEGASVSYNAGYKRGAHQFIVFAKTTLAMLQRERELATELLGKLFEDSFPDLIEEPLVLLVDTGEQLHKIQKGSRSLFAVFVLVDIFNEMKLLLPEFTKVTKVKMSSEKKKDDEVAAMLYKYETQIVKWLTNFLEDLKGESLNVVTAATTAAAAAVAAVASTAQSKEVPQSQTIPPDGTVHESTTTTVNYLKRVLEYKDCLDPYLAGVVGTKSTMALPSDLNNTGVFIHRSFELLQHSLEAKAKRDKRATISTVFLLNNYHHVLKAVRSTPLQETLGSSYPAFAVMYEDLIAKQKAALKASWTTAAQAATLEDPTVKNITKKSYIKDKFKTFNTEVEMLFETQRRFTVPDVDLRNELRGMIAAMIVPVYGAMYARYNDVPFTRNKTKYIRYTKETLKGMVGCLFEGNAV
eukprot:m51a1_g6710 hypothetical protein (793) ;mRNA; f:123428-126671